MAKAKTTRGAVRRKQGNAEYRARVAPLVEPVAAEIDQAVARGEALRQEIQARIEDRLHAHRPAPGARRRTATKRTEPKDGHTAP